MVMSFNRYVAYFGVVGSVENDGGNFCWDRHITWNIRMAMEDNNPVVDEDKNDIVLQEKTIVTPTNILPGHDKSHIGF